jgi:ketol-acid reductoisomerase
MGEKVTEFGKVLVNGVEFNEIRDSELDIELDPESTRKETFDITLGSFSGTIILDRKKSRKAIKKLRRKLLSHKIKRFIKGLFES